MHRKGPEAFRTISEAAVEVGVAPHVLRFWETQFPFIRPLKRAGARRFYRPSDIRILCDLRRLLHEEGRSIREIQGLPRQAWSRPAARLVSERKPGASVAGQLSSGGSLRAALTRAVAAKARLDSVLGSSGH